MRRRIRVVRAGRGRHAITGRARPPDQREEKDVGVSDEGGDGAIFLKHLSLGKNLRVELRANLFGQA